MTRKHVTGLLLAGMAAVSAAGIGAAAVHADERGGPFGEGGWGHRHGRWAALSAEDRAAFTDARIAGLHAGLKLSAEQEKLWPPVETALRDLSKQRDAQRAARRERGRMSEDAPGALRAMADAATARGEALRKLADASTPLFASLDEGQKRRAMVLARPMRPFGGPHGFGHRHGGERD
ncbi:Spy/CpxP family protein refolding chaperone [Methylorubrum thiocyanatum]|uniref:Spy/CpxP family protein refolding chaperone n=1 Tax=Methylorubrum thiocyanatum TaxID=47958 RepID=UPI003F7EACE0